jgi:hypothetical protein
LTYTIAGTTGVASAAGPEATASFAPIEAPSATLPPSAPPPSAPPPSAPPPESAPAPAAGQYGYEPAPEQSWSFQPRTTDSPTPDRARDDRDISENWMLSAEGVTHAPIDIGFQAGIEFPFGLRLFGGYGWVPSGYLDLIVDAASARSDSTGADQVIESAYDSGTAWRIQTGIRPTKKLGLYLDAGYSQVRLTGGLAAEEIATAAGVPPGLVTGDTYSVESTIHMWLVEIGWQATIADHLVLGVGAGVMGTIDSSTDATPSFAGTSAQERAISEVASEVLDQQIESYGFVPTLTLRLGFDLI